MKQIGPNAIANNAITTNKIANGAITGNKISGINKLIFGSCLGSVPNLGPGGFSQFFCLIQMRTLVT